MRKFITLLATSGAALGLSFGLAGAAGAGVKPPRDITNATNACSSSCTDVHFLVPGKHALLAARSGLNIAGNLVRLVHGSNGAPKEDFAEVALSTVDPAYCLGSFPVPGSVFTARQCQLLNNAGLDGATTFELAFNPDNGGPENLCIGATGPKSGDRMRLEPCGVTAATVLIETSSLPGATTTAGSDWLISGASDNFSVPNVATSDGTYPSDPTWSQVVKNGGSGIDTQEVRLESGPFTV